jgi:hypothetical protein
MAKSASVTFESSIPLMSESTINVPLILISSLVTMIATGKMKDYLFNRDLSSLGVEEDRKSISTKAKEVRSIQRDANKLEDMGDNV